jgi:hypothetical protein
MDATVSPAVVVVVLVLVAAILLGVYYIVFVPAEPQASGAVVAPSPGDAPGLAGAGTIQPALSARGPDSNGAPAAPAGDQARNARTEPGATPGSGTSGGRAGTNPIRHHSNQNAPASAAAR